MENKNDTYKELRDSLDSTIRGKLLDNLHGAMLFFIFNQVCLILSELEEIEDDDPLFFHKRFFKEWKKFANKDIIKPDINLINKQLNSDYNIFLGALFDGSETSESTEIYQEKYNKILAEVEKSFFQSFKEQDYD